MPQRRISDATVLCDDFTIDDPAMMTNAVSLTALDPAEQRARWGGAVDPGLLIVPALLLRHQARLGLSSVQLAVLLNVIADWDERSILPAPRPSALAARIGVDVRTVQRSITELDELGLMTRLPSEGCQGLTVRRFDLSGLRRRLDELAGNPHHALRQRAIAS